MPLADDLVALASLAGNTIVAAAATDVWESVRRRVAQLFGRGEERRLQIAAERLEETRRALVGLTGPELEQARAELARRWAERLADLLEEDPGAAAGLRVLVSEVKASGHSVAAGGDLTVSAPGGVAAGAVDAKAVAGAGGTAIGELMYQRREVPSKPVSLPPRPAFLAGREDLLDGLHELVTGDTGPRVAVLHGLGGVGKSSIAVEYGHRHLSEVGLAWFLPAEDQTVLAAEFGRLAGQLRALDVLSPGDPVAAVHGALAEFPAPWLLVFDNVPDAGSVSRFLPPAGRGRVLITSQSAQWQPGQAVDVPALEAAVAAGFLISRTGDPDTEAAADLAAELGGLPLALEQAAAYIQAGGLTLGSYLALYRERRADLLARGTPTGHDATVTATLTLAFAGLEAKAPAAVGLLRLLACLAPDPVPLGLLAAACHNAEFDADTRALVDPVLRDPFAIPDAVSALGCYSLVAPARDGTVLMHRLVQAATLSQMPPELAASWRDAVAALILASIPNDPKLPASWPAFASLLTHARAALDLTSGGMERVAQYLGHSGSYQAALELSRLIADAYEASGLSSPAHPAYLAARHNLAHWTGEAGNPSSARDQFAALVPAFGRVLSAEHPDTLAARGDLAHWTGEAGEPVKARDEYAELVPVLERVLGVEHPETLAARRDLALWTGEAGDAVGARDQYADLVPVIERIHGSEHPIALAARESLANWTGYGGDAASARDLYAALATAMGQVLGPEHPETLATRGNLAHWTGHAGDAVAARDLYATLLTVKERVLGPEHPATLSTRHNLASWTGDAGNPAAARDLHAAVLAVKERVLGPEHPDTLTARQELARFTGELGQPAAARDLYAALLPIRERVSGHQHPMTLLARRNLAVYTAWAGDPATARDMFVAFLPVHRKALGPEHPDTLHELQELACHTGEAGEPAAARDQLAALLPIRERVSGRKHPATLTVRANLARFTGEAGEPAAARDQLAALLPIRERVSGPDRSATLTVRASLARFTGRAGDPVAARDQYTALLPIRERVSGPDHPLTLTVRAGLARFTGEAGDPAAARDQYAALLPIRERVSGPEHPGTLGVRAGLARFTGEAGDPAAARDQYTALLPIRERVSGPEHPDSLAERIALSYWTDCARNEK